MFDIHMLPAAHGDCIFIEYGPTSQRRQLLIDGGVAGTYDKLRPRLLSIPEQRRKLELLVVTHVDADHIEGIVKMLTDETLSFSVQDIWFNAYPQLAAGLPLDFGGTQGEYLSALIQKRKLPWNRASDGGAIVVPAKGKLPTFDLAGGLVLTLLSPNLPKMHKMADAWEDEVRKAGLDPNNPKKALEHLEKKGKRLIAHFAEDDGPDVEALVAEEFTGDTSPANGSSIAFLAEYEKKRILFAADAHSDVLEESIGRLLAERKLDVLELDAFKLPHHGSSANLSPALLERIAAKRFLISSNGDRFEHPDPEAIARMVCRKKPCTLVFNYRSEENRIWDDPRSKKQYGYATEYPATNDDGIQLTI
ncbi:MAG TPA: hypothetical protein PK156_29325 [Polyangium sp.]|nr:hypothetical protein [Polyangium sp.]